jgi:hypothetical protein
VGPITGIVTFAVDTDRAATPCAPLVAYGSPQRPSAFSLPGAKDVSEGPMSNMDIFNDPLDESLPYIRFSSVSP